MVWRLLTRLFATGLGFGYSPLIPGTVGTLVAIPLFLFLAPGGTWAVAAGIAVVTVLGVPAAGSTEKAMGTRDPKPVVIDEIAGYLVTMAGSPADALHVAAGFFLFRFFDILKPPPVRQAERLFPGGLGIMADDLLAGCYAWIFLRIMEVLFL